MLRKRIIPCLQLIDESLVKTVQFKNHQYIGDPINTVRIFNELEVDELAFLDIRATLQKREPNLEILKRIANECFMPLSYGGGINNFETAKNILAIGFEKIIINTEAINNPGLIKELSETFGNQSVIVSIDVKKNLFGKYQIFIEDGTKKTKINLKDWAVEVQKLGAGEILLTSMNQEGTWNGYDIELIKNIVNSVEIPVIANGGAGNTDDIIKVFKETDVSAVALGSMVVFQKKDMGVLVNFPDKEKLEEFLI